MQASNCNHRFHAIDGKQNDTSGKAWYKFVYISYFYMDLRACRA